MRTPSQPSLGAGERIILCGADAKWNKTVADIHFGKEALCPALQRFLLFFAHLLEQAGVAIEIDGILAAVGVARLPGEKGLSEIEEQSLRVMEKKWADLSEDVRGGAADFSRVSQEFMRSVGGYLVSRIVKKTLAEKQQLMMQNFYDALGVGKVIVPHLPFPDEYLQASFTIGRNFIYEPPEDKVSIRLLLQVLPPKMILDDPSKIRLEEVRRGRWLLVDSQSRCPNAGKRSFRGFSMALSGGRRIMTLGQYLIAWHVGAEGGEILDSETDTMLATPYGDDGIVHAYAPQVMDERAMDELQFSVGEWRCLATPRPNMGIRCVEVVA